MSPRRNQPTITMAVLTGLAALTAGGCRPMTFTIPQPSAFFSQPMNILQLTIAGDFMNWDPKQDDSPEGKQLLPLVFETLYDYDYLKTSPTLIPLLAADHPSVSKDGKTVRIPIRADAFFQEDECFGPPRTRPVEARDFVTAFRRTGTSRIDDRIVAVSAPDARTLRLDLREPAPSLTHRLTRIRTAPVPEECLRRYASQDGDWKQHPIGSGPWKLQRWVPRRQLSFERNPRFHRDFFPTEGSPEYRKSGLLMDGGRSLPFIAGIQVTVAGNVFDEWSRFSRRQLDVVPFSPELGRNVFTSGTTLRPSFASRGVRVRMEDGSEMHFLAVNLKSPPLKDSKRRKALASVVNPEEWSRIMTGGFGPPMNGIFPSALGLEQVRTFPAFCRVSRFEATRNLGGLPPLTLDMKGDDPRSRRLASFFQEQFRSAGVRVLPRFNSQTEFEQRIRSGRWQLALRHWVPDFADPESVLEVFAPSMSGNLDFDRLFRQLRTQTEAAARTGTLNRLQSLFASECPLIPGYFSRTIDLLQPWIQNWHGGDFHPRRAKFLKIDSEIRRRYRNVLE